MLSMLASRQLEGVGHWIGDVDVLADHIFAAGAGLLEVHVFEHLQDDFILARLGCRMLVGMFGSQGGGGGDGLAVKSDLPLKARAPVVGHVFAEDGRSIDRQSRFGYSFKYLFHDSISFLGTNAAKATSTKSIAYPYSYGTW